MVYFALSETIFNKRYDTNMLDEIENALGREFGISGPFEIVRIPEGMATNFRIKSADGDWLAKLFQPSYSLDRVKLAADFTLHLAGGGCPVQTFSRTRQGLSVLEIAGRAFVLVPWIAGETRRERSITSSEQIEILGATCGYLHSTAATFPKADLLSSSAVRPRPVIEERWTAFIEKVGPVAQKDSSVGEQIEVRAEVITRLGEEMEWSEQFSELQTIHGDFYCSHAIWRDDAIIGVIDAVGGRQPFGWELMRCFTQSVPNLWELNISEVTALWDDYFRGYRTHVQVDAEHLSRGYDVYLLQLTLSAFGLTVSDLLDSNLAQFGRWRTATASYLANNRAILKPLLFD